MKIRVTSQFKVAGSADLDRETDALFDALIAVERESPDLFESDLSVVLLHEMVTMSIVVDSLTWEAAQERGSAAIARAVEMVGGKIQDFDPGQGVQGDLRASIQSTELVPA